MSDAMRATPAPPSPPSKLKVFLRRFVSFVVLWSIVLVALFSSHPWVSDYVFILIMVFLGMTGLAEFYGLVAKRGLVCFERWGIFGGVLLMVGTFLNLTGHIGTSGSPPALTISRPAFSSCLSSASVSANSLLAATRPESWPFQQPCSA